MQLQIKWAFVWFNLRKYGLTKVPPNHLPRSGVSRSPSLVTTPHRESLQTL